MTIQEIIIEAAAKAAKNNSLTIEEFIAATKRNHDQANKCAVEIKQATAWASVEMIAAALGISVNLFRARIQCHYLAVRRSK